MPRWRAVVLMAHKANKIQTPQHFLFAHNARNVHNVRNMSDKLRRCMTTLTPEMQEVLPSVERATGMSVSDLLRVGFAKVAKEVMTTGKLTVEPIGTAAVAQN